MGDDFFDFLHTFLEFTVVGDNDPRGDILNERFDSYWIDAFSQTTKTYAKLKYLGTDDFKSGFKHYICHHYSSESPHVLSTINNTYITKKYLKKMSINLGFDRYSDSDLDSNSYILESVFGALAIIGRELYATDVKKYYHPQELNFRFFVRYFEKHPINVKEEGEYVWITELERYWKFFTKSTFNPKKDKDTGLPQILTDDLYDGLKDYSVESSKIIKEMKALKFPEDVDRDEWAQIVMKVLIKYGFTRQWLVENTKNFSLEDDPVIQKIATDNGYTRFVIESRFDNSVKYYQLVGEWVEEKKGFKRVRQDIIKILPATRDFKSQARKTLIETQWG